MYRSDDTEGIVGGACFVFCRLGGGKGARTKKFSKDIESCGTDLQLYGFQIQSAASSSLSSVLSM